MMPAELLDENTKYLRQPHRPLRGRRPAGRLRPDRPQDHRGHLRRLRRTTAAAAFSGKDPTKVDRSAAYMRRATWPRTWWPPACASKCEVERGLRHRRGPARVRLGGHLRHRRAARRRSWPSIVDKCFDLRPAAIIARPGPAAAPSTQQTAAYGHFGRDDLDLTWEKLDKVDELKAAAGIQRELFPNSITERFPAWRALRFSRGFRRSSPQKPLLLRIWRGVRPV